MNAPCFNCKDRHIGCHGECALYIQYDQERKELRGSLVNPISNRMLKGRNYAAHILNERNKQKGTNKCY